MLGLCEKCGCGDLEAAPVVKAGQKIGLGGAAQFAHQRLAILGQPVDQAQALCRQQQHQRGEYQQAGTQRQNPCQVYVRARRKAFAGLVNILCGLDHLLLQEGHDA